VACDVEIFHDPDHHAAILLPTYEL